jgi:hypothetical protein
MPRKWREPKRRRVPELDVPPALYRFLLWSDWRGARRLDADHTAVRLLFDTREHPRYWQAMEAAALADWIVSYPGTRPPSWWYFSAPALRQVSGRFTPAESVVRAQPTGIPFGSPDDADDLPMVESCAAFLDRFDLWLPGERARVPAAAFDPQPFDFTLTVAPRVEADDDDRDDHDADDDNADDDNAA